VIRTLDTDICSYILRKRPPEVRQRFERIRSDQIWLSVIVAAELRYGAQRSGSARIGAAIEAWIAGFEIRPWTEAASHHYAQIRHDLAVAGHPIGGMDLLIAAHALAEDSVLVTRNTREFLRVPGLAVEQWLKTPARAAASPDTDRSHSS
jgi:tRNA(fMet)-specific endonuclease VapC